ncbi:MAG: isopeptide-forming domain-containing fimbrial protein [Lachnospiraceae bacterium]|nr:SpaA isopeptide-forming pilin-related protein [uncultured Acetatifactor sp.]MCI9574278.1 isopeptide-forming domain-containing fimbrial protein [Lachnospiraceae bacterium]
MKKMKKILAMVLAVVMAMGMSVTALAAQTETGVASKTDTEKVSISGISGKATVTLFQIAEGVYGESGKGLIKYEYREGITPLSEQPTSGEINAIHQAILTGNTKATEADKKEKVEGEFESKDLNAGAYLAIISGAEDGSVYNPVLLTVSYNKNGALEAGNVDITQGYIYGSSAVAKKTTPDIDKEIVGGTTSDPDGNHETAGIGDVVTYQITPTMPNYPENATNKTLFVSDKMSEGLSFIFDSLEISLKDTQKEVTRRDGSKGKDGIATFTIDKDGETVTIATAKKSENGFYLNFDYDALVYGTDTFVDDDIDSMGLQVSSVYTPVIKYQAVINDKAVVGNNGNPNDAKLYYANQPNTGDTFEPTDKNPTPNGQTPGVTEKEDKEIVYTYQLAFLKTGEGDDAEKLAGAVFGIYADSTCTQLIDVVKTNGDGYAVSSKVKAGTYYIKELVAPQGYTLNDKVYSIEATWATATSTVTTTNREWKYTTDEPDENAVQVGWIDTKGTDDSSDDVFYALDEYNVVAADDDVDNMGVSTLPASFAPAYVVYDKTEVTTTVETEARDGAGTATGLKELDGDSVGSIPNTKLASLPSTGGIGTTIFTIGGCAIMIVAAGLFFATRRKAEK